MLLAALAGCAGNKEAIRKEAKASFQLGVAFLAEGRTAPALRELSKAESLNPGDPEVLNALGLAYWARKEYALAEQKLKAATQVKPDYSEAWNNLGAMYIDQGRFDDAIPALEAALKSVFYGSQEAALSNLGWALFKTGRYAEAERRLHEAIEVAPGFPLARKFLGILLEDRGRYQEALAQLDAAIPLFPEKAYGHLAEVQLHRGLCLLHLGDRDAARKAFDKAWRLAPGGDVGKSAKNYLNLLN